MTPTPMISDSMPASSVVPRLSVIIPTYNRRDTLVAAIDSVLAQSWSDYEIVVSDNASDDGTDVMMAQRYSDEWRVRYVRNSQNIGMIANWRKALFEVARGEWFTLLSDDDVLLDEHYYTHAFQLIETQPALRFVYAGANIRYEMENREVRQVLPFGGVVDGLTVFASRGTVKPLDIALCTMIFRRADAAAFDFMGTPDNLSGDTEFYLKLCLHGPVGVLPGPVAMYRLHGGNLVSMVNRSIRLNSANLAMLIEPYVMARGRIPDSVVEQYCRNARVQQSMESALLAAWCFDARRYHTLSAALRARVPELMPRGVRRIRFELKRAVVRTLAPWLRRRYGLLD